jgi:hypothetical protein
VKFTGTCSIEGCEKWVLARGWCPAHYSRWKKYGDPLGVAPPRLPRICSVEGCGERVIARNWCGIHYSRWQRHGDPLTMHRAGNGEGTISPAGYRLKYSGGRVRLEHHLVVEEALGRLLRPDEMVHHINHDKLDNRLENLQIMTRSEHTRLHNDLRRENEAATSEECGRRGTT